MGFNRAGKSDDTLLVGRVTSDYGTLVATIVNYACHPTTLAWENSLLSPDYVRAMREVVEGSTDGALCTFLQGASGELAPRYQYVGDPKVADHHGRQLGYAVVSVLYSMYPAGTCLSRSGTVESAAPLAIWRPVPGTRSGIARARMSVLALAMRPLPSVEELTARWAGIDPVSVGERISRARSLRASYGEARTVSYPVWCWRVGDSYFVAHPGEAYSDLQRSLRQRHGFQVAVLNLSNGPGFFYLPTDAAYDVDAYQSWQTLVDRGALGAVVDEATHMIRELSSVGEN